MADRDLPEELAALDKELAGVTRRVERRTDPSPSAALVVAVAMLTLLGGLLLPWRLAFRPSRVIARQRLCHQPAHE